MATEKREGLEVRGYESKMTGSIWAAIEVLAPDRYHPLVRLSDAQAEVARAWEAGRLEGMRKYGHQEGHRYGLEQGIRGLKRLIAELEDEARPLRPLPAPPPEREGGAG